MTTLYTLDDLENLELKCSTEGGYSSPIMKDKYGNSMYAYVTLVMLGDAYISAAIVLAYTLKKLHTQADLVVITTNDVSKEGKELLRQFYTKVIEIDFVEVINWRGIKQPHRKYLNYVFTKFHVFNLIEYKKVLLIDADALVLKHPDHLFSLNTPAGVYLEDKSLFITYDAKGNYILPDENKIKWYEEFCECCEHGKLIPKSITDRILKNNKNSGIGGGLMLLEPKEGELESIIEDVKRGQSKYLINKFFVWPEQQYLSIRYSGKWHSINPVFFGLQGYPHWKVLFGLQYAGDKPFILKSKYPISERMKYPDFTLWHYFLSEILAKDPTLENHKSLDDAVKMNYYFRKYGKLLRENNALLTHRYKFEDLDAIEKLLQIDKKKINKNDIQYYHTDFTIPYSNNSAEPLFDINLNNYNSLLSNLSHMCDKMDTSYFSDLNNKFNSLNTKEPRIDKINGLSSIEKDTLALYYTMCRKDMFVITVWPKGVSQVKTLINYLQADGNVCYVKYITADYNTIRNCSFFMYNTFTIQERFNFIDKKLSYINVNKDSINTICIILFDNIFHKKLAGQGSTYKKELRHKMSKILSKDGEIIWGNDLIHVNDYYDETIEYCQMYLNQNSMDIMKMQNLDRITHNSYATFSNRFQTLRKWCYMNINAQERMRFCAMGGLIWYILGVRPSNDIDGIFVNTHESSEREKKFTSLLYKYFVDNHSKFEFADMGLEDSEHWNSKWSIKNNVLLKALGIKSFDEIVMNPNYHFYYNGIKVYKMDYEIVRKFIRIRGQDIADIAMLYLNFKNIVGTQIQMDNNNKIIYPKYTGELWDNNKTFQKAYDLIKKRYTLRDTSIVTISMLKHMFSKK